MMGYLPEFSELFTVILDGYRQCMKSIITNRVERKAVYICIGYNIMRYRSIHLHKY